MMQTCLMVIMLIMLKLEGAVVMQKCMLIWIQLMLHRRREPVHPARRPRKLVLLDMYYQQLCVQILSLIYVFLNFIHVFGSLSFKIIPLQYQTKLFLWFMENKICIINAIRWSDEIVCIVPYLFNIWVHGHSITIL